MTTMLSPDFDVSLAVSADDLDAAKRLRYDVFVTELGADGPGVDHAAYHEEDRFDPFAKHLLLRDRNLPAGRDVVGAYRLLTQKGAAAAGQFYCEDEYDLTPLKRSEKPLLELGRSCLHPDYRGGAGLMHLWQAVSDIVAREKIGILFGVASFHGTDADGLAGPLSLLHHRHLAPPHLRVTAKGDAARPLNTVPEDQIDRVAAMRQTPSLIKAYLRLGGCVGQGAFVDHAFNTTDICLILDTHNLTARGRKLYQGGITADV
ncbi:GNAT family N-acyltransferase [Yoonia sp. BS5-3]|uniref:L-ornithine N(alpha)-acyltransferase n=1 Tax=Yoonia phaeophyticola TaxID=3137369 RepID=A0ABZ2V283_9RHOB